MYCVLRSLLLFITTSYLALGQTQTCSPNWIRSAGSESRDWATSLKEAPNGDLMMAGYTKSFVTFPPAQRNMFWAARLTPTGNPIWQRQLGELGFNDDAFAMVLTSDGGMVLAGNTTRFGDTRSTDGWIVKLSGDGDLLWERLYGGTGGDSIAQLKPTSDGGFVACGASSSFSGQTDQFDAWVFKINADGDLQWSYTYGGSEADVANDIRQTPDGGYHVVGYTSSFGAANLNGWVLKLNSPGFIQWQRRFEKATPTLFETLADAGMGESVIGGRSSLLKLDTLGQIVWQKSFPGVFFQSATRTNDDQLILAGGYFAPNIDFPDIGVHKLDLNGNPIWRKRYEIFGDEWNHSISQASDGSLLLANYATGLGGLTDAWLFRLKSDGRVYLENSLNISDITVAPTAGNLVIHTTDATPQNATFAVTNTSSLVETISPEFTAFAGCSFQGASEDWPCVTVLDILALLAILCP